MRELKLEKHYTLHPLKARHFWIFWIFLIFLKNSTSAHSLPSLSSILPPWVRQAETVQSPPLALISSRSFCSRPLRPFVHEEEEEGEEKRDMCCWNYSGIGVPKMPFDGFNAANFKDFAYPKWRSLRYRQQLYALNPSITSSILTFLNKTMQFYVYFSLCPIVFLNFKDFFQLPTWRTGCTLWGFLLTAYAVALWPFLPGLLPNWTDTQEGALLLL